MNLTIVIYDSDRQLLDRIRLDCSAQKYVEFVVGNGPTASRIAHLDAIWCSPMEALELGMNVSLANHQAGVFQMPQQWVQKGLPTYAVVGVPTSKDDPRTPDFELPMIVSALAKAVKQFNEGPNPRITRVGFLPDHLWLRKLAPGAAMTIIDKALTASTRVAHSSGEQET
jgi:hypothetical protein